MGKRYTDLVLPRAPLAREDRHTAWNQAVTFSPKTVPMYWHEDTVYLYGVDLFNHQLFWEAHEVWERKWSHLKAHHPTYAPWMQGLIQVAASMLKHREGNVHGFQSTLGKACVHFQCYENMQVVMGVDLPRWLTEVHGFVEKPDRGYPIIELTYP